VQAVQAAPGRNRMEVNAADLQECSHLQGAAWATLQVASAC
jgi:hypothetical protein